MKRPQSSMPKTEGVLLAACLASVLTELLFVCTSLLAKEDRPEYTIRFLSLEN